MPFGVIHRSSCEFQNYINALIDFEEFATLNKLQSCSVKSIAWNQDTEGRLSVSNTNHRRERDQGEADAAFHISIRYDHGPILRKVQALWSGFSLCLKNCQGRR